MIIKPPFRGSAIFTCGLRLTALPAPGGVVEFSETDAVLHGDTAGPEEWFDGSPPQIVFNPYTRQLTVSRDCFCTCSVWLQIDSETVSAKYLRIGTVPSVKSARVTFVGGFAQTEWTGELGPGTLINPVVDTDLDLTLYDGAFTGTFGPL
jgi:hypothetical protein